MTLVLWVIVPVLGWLGWQWLLRRQIQHRSPDPALIILPPRRYVDADGRSDFRPECWERHRRL